MMFIQMFSPLWVLRCYHIIKLYKPRMYHTIVNDTLGSMLQFIRKKRLVPLEIKDLSYHCVYTSVHSEISVHSSIQ